VGKPIVDSRLGDSSVKLWLGSHKNDIREDSGCTGPDTRSSSVAGLPTLRRVCNNLEGFGAVSLCGSSMNPPDPLTDVDGGYPFLSALPNFIHRAVQPAADLAGRFE
jgi:hypothetical protein